MALYIGTNYGDDSCQEWVSEKQLVLLEPTYPATVLTRHQACVQAMTDRVTKLIANLEKQRRVTEDGLANTPDDLGLLKNQMEVENKLELAKFELTDVVEVKITADKAMAFNNAWCRSPDSWVWTDLYRACPSIPRSASHSRQHH